MGGFQLAKKSQAELLNELKRLQELYDQLENEDKQAKTQTVATPAANQLSSTKGRVKSAKVWFSIFKVLRSFLNVYNCLLCDNYAEGCHQQQTPVLTPNHGVTKQQKTTSSKQKKLSDNAPKPGSYQTTLASLLGISSTAAADVKTNTQDKDQTFNKPADKPSSPTVTSAPAAPASSSSNSHCNSSSYSSGNISLSQQKAISTTTSTSFQSAPATAHYDER